MCIPSPHLTMLLGRSHVATTTPQCPSLQVCIISVHSPSIYSTAPSATHLTINSSSKNSFPPSALPIITSPWSSHLPISSTSLSAYILSLPLCTPSPCAHSSAYFAAHFPFTKLRHLFPDTWLIPQIPAVIKFTSQGALSASYYIHARDSSMDLVLSRSFSPYILSSP